MFFSRWRRKAAKSDQVAPKLDLQRVEKVRALLQSADLRQAEEEIGAMEAAWGDSAELGLLRAGLLRRPGRHAEAISICESAVIEAERPALAQFELAESHLAVPDLSAALDALSVAVSLEPDFFEAWFRLGELLRRQSHHDQALEAMERALPLAPDPAMRAKVWLHIGMNRFALNRVESAIAAYREAIELSPDMIEAHTGLGHAHLWRDEEDRALTEYEWVLEHDSSPSKSLLLSLGSAYQNCGDYSKARAFFGRVMAEHPGDHLARWYTCQLDLIEERWEEGWRNYGARYGAGASPYRPLPFRLWDGREASNDSLLILADQGIGDEIMFASCVKDAQQRVGKLILECEPRLEAIFARSFPGVQVVSNPRDKSLDWLDKFDPPQWQIPSGDLPALFRSRAEDFPVHGRYLQADERRMEHWAQRLSGLGPGLKVGLSWRGGTDRTRLRARSVPLPMWADILKAPGMQFVNLQYGEYNEELRALQDLHGVTVHDFPEAIADYDETAALVSQLDLVVTVCTAIVHLAGALGRPVWVLIPHAPGWRYTARSDRLAWYPSSRLFRQPSWGDWEGACQELSLSLRSMTNLVAPAG